GSYLTVVLSILSRGDAHLPLEGAAQRVGVREPAMCSDLLGRLIAFLQEAACGFDPDAFDPSGRRDAYFCTKQAREMARRDAHSLRQRRHAQVLGRIVRGPALDPLQCGAADKMGLLLAAELHLAARPLEEHHELAGDQ